MGVDSPLPAGSTAIASWAASKRLRYEARPEEAWFRKWEPHDTIAPPSHFFNACTWVDKSAKAPVHVVMVEPWYAAEDGEPLERTLLAFATHPGLVRRAAIRVEEHFLTRVAFLENAPPPRVHIGDRVWDQHVTTFAASPSEAETAFHPRVRKLLVGWGFRGHLEIRAGGLVLHLAGIRPTPADYDRLFLTVREVVDKASNPRK